MRRISMLLVLVAAVALASAATSQAASRVVHRSRVAHVLANAGTCTNPAACSNRPGCSGCPNGTRASAASATKSVASGRSCPVDASSCPASCRRDGAAAVAVAVTPKAH